MPHVDSNFVSSVPTDIDSEYGKLRKIAITQGKVHKYLGIITEYFFPGKIKFSMVSYILNIFDCIH